MPVKHAPHLCYHCGCTILKDQEEKRVEGLKETSIRYQHATEEGCRAALGRQVGYGNVFSDDPDEAENQYQGRPPYTGRHRG